ncbi:MAG: bifunctional DNA-formamidopyrimidine glycosylase/DNA-(apurinic or apyrimidinic site) lyase [Nitrococcus mobilis]|nr:bifunctional DNA-formamidopyrimidine glycosylase/DNA-(apurinic or apyrimidinic site) lyase [Nitrococcus mobilis]
MPELPEVEITRRGIEPHVRGRRIAKIIIRDARLRWPIAESLPGQARDRRIIGVQRRAKYLLFRLEADATLILHLGMSGSLRLVAAQDPPLAHAHLDIILANGRALRYTDPRRFGSLHWSTGDPEQHHLLANLGPEPLSSAFHADYLYALSRGRRVCAKTLLMDSRVVVGIGNIYANEALYRAAIRPTRSVGQIGRNRYTRLVQAAKSVLAEAIEAGGTTLRNFTGSTGQPGYFRRRLEVYGRGGAACPRCAGVIRMERLGQRATYYCPGCQF